MTTWKAKPLHFAAASGSESVCQLLLTVSGIQPNDQDSIGRTALYYAVKREHFDVVQLLLAHPKIDVNIGSWLPLQAAIRNDDCINTRALLDSGVDPYLVEFDVGSRPLHEAVFIQNIDMVRLLIETRSDIMNDYGYGNTALMYAIHGGWVESAHHLLGFTNINVNFIDEHGQTPIMGAAEEGHDHLVEYLLSY